MNFVDIDIPFDEAENYFKANNREKLNRLFYKDRNFDKLTLDTTYYLIGEKRKWQNDLLCLFLQQYS